MARWTCALAVALKRDSGERVLFVDVRSSEEAMFVGMAGLVDALGPFSELPARRAVGRLARRRELADSQRFLAELDARVAEQGLDHASPVIFLRRSGDRSARAVATACPGYVYAFSVVDDSEGDVSPARRRDVNGRKNSGLAWSGRLEASKLPGR